jgi:hypothetical protein
MAGNEGGGISAGMGDIEQLPPQGMQINIPLPGTAQPMTVSQILLSWAALWNSLQQMTRWLPLHFLSELRNYL